MLRRRQRLHSLGNRTKIHTKLIKYVVFSFWFLCIQCIHTKRILNLVFREFHARHSGMWSTLCTPATQTHQHVFHLKQFHYHRTTAMQWCSVFGSDLAEIECAIGGHQARNQYHAVSFWLFWKFDDLILLLFHLFFISNKTYFYSVRKCHQIRMHALNI